MTSWQKPENLAFEHIQAENVVRLKKRRRYRNLPDVICSSPVSDSSRDIQRLAVEVSRRKLTKEET